MLKDNGLKTLVAQVLGYKKKQHWTSNTKITQYYYFEGDLLRNLVYSGHGAFVKNYVEFNSDKQVTRFKLYDGVYQKYLDEKKILDDKQDISVWHAWDELCLAYLVIVEGEQRLQDLRKQYKIFDKWWEGVNWYLLKEEMQKIKSGFHANEKRYLFQRTSYNLYAQRVHLYISKELKTSPALKQKNVYSKKPHFDSKQSILHFQNNVIVISNTKNTSPHYLLKTIFKNITKVWNYDEIAEDWDEEYDQKKWRKYYNASYETNEKIAKKTTINDFLKPTRCSVKINEKYL